MLTPLTKSFPQDMITIYLNLWIVESNRRTNYNFEKNYTMVKLIEILVHLNIPLHILFEYLTKTDYVRKLFYYYAQQKPSKKVIPLLSYKNAVLES